MTILAKSPLLWKVLQHSKATWEMDLGVDAEGRSQNSVPPPCTFRGTFWADRQDVWMPGRRGKLPPLRYFKSVALKPK